MTETVKAKVAEHHFKKQVNIGGKTLDRDEPKQVEVNTTLKNMVRAGNVVITEGSLRPERDEKEFQGDDESGEADPRDDGKTGEEEEQDPDAKAEGEDLEDLSYRDLQKKAGDIEDVDATQKKEELVEDLKDELE